MLVQKFTLAFFTTLVVTFLVAGQANATPIVNTGTPVVTPDVDNWAFRDNQYFGGRFAVGNDYIINSVEGYFSDGDALSGAVVVALHATGAFPGAVLFSASLNIPGTLPLDWHGVSGLSWAVGPGTYWVSFRPDSSVHGSMPGTAPSPMEEYAQGGTPGWFGFAPDNRDFLGVGVRIQAELSPAAVPEPTSMLLLGTGLAAVGVRRYRRRPVTT